MQDAAAYRQVLYLNYSNQLVQGLQSSCSHSQSVPHTYNKSPYEYT
jgi:hypothetical protein